MESQSILYGPEEELSEKSLLFHRIFEDLIEDHPDLAHKRALVFNNTSVSFEQLNNRANKLSRCLSEYLDNNGKIDGKEGNASNIIAVFLPPSDDLIVLLLAILKLGISYVPLDYSFPVNRTSHILIDSRPLAIVCTRDSLTKIPKSWKGLIIEHEKLMENLIGSKHSVRNLDSDEMIDPNPSIAAVLYTSGSTGIPKGAALKYSSLLNRLKWQWKQFPFGENETCIFKTTLAFVDSISEIFGPLLQGKELVIVSAEDKKNTQALVNILKKYEIERMMLVPSLLRSIFFYIRISKIELSKMRLIVSSAETVTVEFLREFFQVFQNNTIFANFYGSTEITDVTYSVFNSPQDIRDKTVDGKVPIGVPVTNTNIYVLNENRKVIPQGSIGEIFVSGKNVSKYLNQSNDSKYIKNEIDFKTGHDFLYNTGDFGRIVNDTLLYEGRNDSQIKIRGQRVDMSEIERSISTIPGVISCVVLCYHTGKEDQTILAFYKTKLENLNEIKLDKILSEKLPNHMMPFIYRVDDFPLLYNGKIDRQSLINQFETKAKSNLENNNFELNLTQFDSTERDAASILFKVISQVLGFTRKNNISFDSNFFDIGGNSLNVLNTISLLMDKGYSIGISEFLQAISLRDIVHKMQPSTEWIIDKLPKKYRSVPIIDIPKTKIQSLISISFISRGDLDQYAETTIDDFLEFVENLWDSFTMSNASFGIVDENNEFIGVALNTNLKDEPQFKLKTRMEIIIDFLEHVEGPICTKLLEKENKIMHALLLGTANHLTAAENVELAQFIEKENVRIAKENNFDLIVTTNTSRLTQDICSKLLKYEILKSVRINQYRDKNGLYPFASAPYDYCVHVVVKYLK